MNPRPPPQSFGERLDRLIGVFFPKTAAQRAAWRHAAELNYRSGSHRRVDVARSTGGSADYHLEAARDRRTMVDRSHELDRNNILGSSLLDRAVENIVECGMTPQAKSDDEKWNADVEARFNDWGEREADVRGLSSFGELQRLTMRSLLRDGDVGTILLADGSLQSIESDQIADPADKYSDPRFIDGVEVNAKGRPIAYHVVDDADIQRWNPSRRENVKRKRIPAEDFIFLSRRKRLNQTRGEPVFAQSFWLFDQVDGNIEAVTMAARMAACFGLVLEQQSSGPMAGLDTAESNGATYKKWNVEPGMIKRLEPGDQLKQITPQHPGTNFPEFIRLLGRLLGLPLGLPLELIFMDFSQTNFSSARGSLLQAYRSFRGHQGYFKSRWLAPLWRWRVGKWIEDGTIDEVPGWERHEWQAPAWQWVDPVAEVNSNLAAIDAGFKTVRDVVQEQGRDFADLCEQRTREIKDMKAAGMPVIHSTLTRDPTPEPKPASDGAPKKTA